VQVDSGCVKDEQCARLACEKLASLLNEGTGTAVEAFRALEGINMYCKHTHRPETLHALRVL
jgi:hypothetical protein